MIIKLNVIEEGTSMLKIYTFFWLCFLPFDLLFKFTLQAIKTEPLFYYSTLPIFKNDTLKLCQQLNFFSFFSLYSFCIIAPFLVIYMDTDYGYFKFTCITLVHLLHMIIINKILIYTKVKHKYNMFYLLVFLTAYFFIILKNISFANLNISFSHLLLISLLFYFLSTFVLKYLWRDFYIMDRI